MTRPDTPQNDTPPVVDRSSLPEAPPSARRLNLTKLLGLCVGGALIAAVLILPTLRGQDTAEEEKKDDTLQVRQTVAMQDRTPPEPPADPIDEAPPGRPPARPATVVQAEASPPDDESQKILDAARRAPVLVFNNGSTPDAPPSPATPVQPAAPSQAPDPDRGLGRLLDTTTIGRARAVQLGDLNLLLTAGTLVPCILDTAIDTTSPGFVSCHLERDVLSANGLVVLLDRGTRVLGEYSQGLRQGQERIFVVWNRAVTPDGVAVDLGSPAADDLGRAGFDGQVETYFWTRFGATMLLSIISDAVAVGRDQLRGGSGGNGVTVDNSAGSVNSAAADALNNSINIPPVLRKNQGEAVSIFVARDLDFSGVYRLHASRGRP
ncbi:MAG: type IV secretion system protein VirB10 [Inquilinus sp.]|uniref:type IV secretion system protein VirB10 n=1 Tax=Inquilinus sp. TaxID=1932117 RepID=UPI003F2FBCB3